MLYIHWWNHEYHQFRTSFELQCIWCLPFKSFLYCYAQATFSATLRKLDLLCNKVLAMHKSLSVTLLCGLIDCDLLFPGEARSDTSGTSMESADTATMHHNQALHPAGTHSNPIPSSVLSKPVWTIPPRVYPPPQPSKTPAPQQPQDHKCTCYFTCCSSFKFATCTVSCILGWPPVLPTPPCVSASVSPHIGSHCRAAL